MTLHPGDRIGPYEIVSALGAGGMGEVYRARDSRLNRQIALKVLPAAAAGDAERRERFEREAQAVAALNHPGIVTIHSVERIDDQFLLTMELVEGRSLADAIPKHGLPLNRLLDIAIPVADAVAAAHQKGITHRDLKPANIMLGEGTHAGRVKVLDFGLAKLAESPVEAAGLTALPTTPITGQGKILGTVAYMSPEQAEGKAIDARSDLFSLGVVLYEMATGQRPFDGETNISILSSIIKDTPKSVTELNPSLPRDLARIIRRALLKDPERRYQTAKDLRSDLEELKTSLESGELTAQPAAVVTRRRTPVALGTIALIAVAVGLYALLTRESRPSAPESAAPTRQIESAVLTTSGTATRPAVSPDGKFVVYINQPKELGSGPPNSVWVRQVATSSNVQILPPDPMLVYLGLTVTPDGNFVDVVRTIHGKAHGELWRVSLLGGVPKKLIDDVTTTVGWSRDGKQMAFVRDNLAGGVTTLMIADADGSNVRALAVRRRGSIFSSLYLVGFPAVGPAWSPDGRLIAVHGFTRSGRPHAEIVFVDVATGTEKKTIEISRGDLDGLAWSDSGSVLVNKAVEIGAAAQIWRLSYPDGAMTRLVSDLSAYKGLSVTAAGDIVTSRVDHRVTIAVGNGDGSNMKDIASAPVSRGYEALTWGGSRLFFTGISGGVSSVSSLSLDGSAPQDVVSHARSPHASTDGRTLVFISTDPMKPGLWKTVDGGPPVQLTAQQSAWPLIADGDRRVVFVSGAEDLQSLWSISIDGGTPVRLTKEFAANPTLTADGRSVLFPSRDEKNRRALVLCDLPDCSHRQSLQPPLPSSAVPRLRPQGLTVIMGTPANLWLQPLDGSPAHQVTRFVDDRTIVDADWSHDGRQLAVASATTTNDIVILKGLKR